MRLKFTFETMELDDKIVALPVGEGVNEYHGVIKLNETAAFIFNLLRKNTTEEDIVDALVEKYDAPREIITRDVHQYINEFQEKGFLT